MQKAIHPEYFPQAKAKCACGATYRVGSTLKELNVEICQTCHQAKALKIKSKKINDQYFIG